MTTKRERLDRDTKNAYRSNRRAGWKAAAAIERALAFDAAMRRGRGQGVS